MNLEDLGYNTQFEQFRKQQNLTNLDIGRIIAEHKERYVVRTEHGEFHAEITGNMRFTATSRQDFPAVGDWVALSVYDTDLAIIHQIYPRFSLIKRQAVGQTGEVQVIAANIDSAFIIQAIDRDFNLNRIERYLTICHSSNVHPVIVLSKIDLISESDASELLQNVCSRINNVPVLSISNTTMNGYDAIRSMIKKGKTYCLLGSSGVGKSTLLNNLAGKNMMKTESISKTANRGRHVTTHRELITLENGGILIDNPGMREIGIADNSEGLELTFNQIIRFSEKCKYKDCTHTSESGCAIRTAVENGEIEPLAYENYLKIEREKAFFESTVAERRKKERLFGRIIKNYKKDQGKNRF